MGSRGCSPWGASPSKEPVVPEGKQRLEKNPYRFFDMREGVTFADLQAVARSWINMDFSKGEKSEQKIKIREKKQKPVSTSSRQVSPSPAFCRQYRDPR